MKDKVFLDTNIFIYAVDTTLVNRKKQEVARKLVTTHIEQETGVISIQVLQEFLVVSTAKLKVPLHLEAAIEFLQFMSNLEIIHPDFEMILNAARIQKKYRLSFWDAMVIQTARVADCTVLLTEDLQPGLRIGSLAIQNPFQ